MRVSGLARALRVPALLLLLASLAGLGQLVQPVAAFAGGGAFAGRGTKIADVASAPSASGTPEALISVVPSQTPPAGRRLSADRAFEIAGALPRMQRLRAANPGSSASVYLQGRHRWQVAYFAAKGDEIGEVVIADRSGKVLEQWTGIQVSWSMARGYPGAFGGVANALWLWLPLCLLFFWPFVDWRRPLRLLHLDLLVLLSFSVSLAFFNHGLIDESVPLAYPPLVYLLARMLWLALRPAAFAWRPDTALRPRVPSKWLAVGLAVLVVLRIVLNVSNGNVIDVGYAGVVGASRMTHGQPLYGGYPEAVAHGDTYGPFAYEAYVPFVQLLGWSGTWDSLPAAHAAAIFFDLLTMALLFLLGRRIRGPSLGLALAYAWASYPFTLLVLDSDSNDALVAVCVLAALLCVKPAARGAMSALAGLTKLAPFALTPLLASASWQETKANATSGARAPAGAGASAGASSRVRASAGFRAPGRRWRRGLAPLVFLLGFIAIGAFASLPGLLHDSLHTIYERVIAYQADRDTPFSVWGLYRLHRVGQAVEAAALLLAVGLAFVRRRPGLPSLAAACASILIAVQLGLPYWLYLYIPWFFPLVLLALAGQGSAVGGSSGADSSSGSRREGSEDEASGSARSRPLSAAVSS